MYPCMVELTCGGKGSLEAWYTFWEPPHCVLSVVERLHVMRWGSLHSSSVAWRSDSAVALMYRNALVSRAKP